MPRSTGSLPRNPAQRLAEINAHLKECESCRNRVEQASEDDALSASVNRALGSDTTILPVDIMRAGPTTSGGIVEINQNEAPRNIPKISGFKINGVLGQGEAKPNHRLIAAIVDHPKGPHFVKASGSVECMKRWEASILAFLESAQVN